MVQAKRPSINEVAQRAEVSVATVSNVLGARKAVRPELAARVRAAAKSLGYQADRAASQLRSGKASVVGLLVPSLENPFFTSIIAAVEQAVQPDGFDIIVASSNNDPDVELKRLATLLAWRPAGIIILPTDDKFVARNMLLDSGIPFVVVDRLPTGNDADVVAIDNQQAAALAGQHLIGLGHRNVLVVASTLALGNIRERRAGLELVFAEAGILPPKVLEVGLTLESVANGLAGWLERERPTGIIALTNFTTIGLIAALSQAAIKVPHNVSLVGFDDYVWMQAATPPITAVRQPVERLGAEAWAGLKERIDGTRQETKHLRLACTLVVRASTAHLKGRVVATRARREAKTVRNTAIF